MADQTEAACLLETGAMYGKRVLLRREVGDPIFAGFKPGAFSLYFGDAPIFHFDREGRWQRAYCDDRHYLKGLDASVQTIDRVREGNNLVLKRATLGDAEAAEFDERVRSSALGLIEALGAGRLETVAPPAGLRPVAPAELRGALEGVAGWDAGAWSSHRALYRQTYGAWPFLPPDCPSPVVLQATTGLAFGGAMAVGRSARSPDEFEDHARAVARLLGRRVEQCKSVFLGGVDALRRPFDDVAAYLDIASRVFPIDPAPGPRHPVAVEGAPFRLGGIHAFLDQFSAPWFDRDSLRGLRARGLARVSLGVESGDPVVRAGFGKTWADEALCATASDLKAAGIGVSVIALVGATSGRHVDATSELINSLDLGPGDLVSLLDQVELAGPGATVMPAPARAAQLDALKARLAPVRAERKAKVVAYNPEKQGGS